MDKNSTATANSLRHHDEARDQVLVTGLVRDCGSRLEKDITTICRALSRFKSVHWLVVESDSSDNSVEELEKLRRSVANFRFISLGNLREKMPLRAERLAHCRNMCLDEIRATAQYREINYIVVADLDGINSELTREAVDSCWSRRDWDVCTANQRGAYYDTWALRHSKWNAGDCWAQARFLRQYGISRFCATYAAVYSLMIQVPGDSDWIEVISAFGGFAIYRKDTILSSRYQGLDATGREVSEHVFLHETISSNGGRIFINPALINGGFNEHTMIIRYTGLRYSVILGRILFPVYRLLAGIARKVRRLRKS